MPRLLPPAILACCLALAACGQEPRTREVTVANLVAGSNHFIGSRVSTQGVVHSFPQPLHYWLEDNNLNRVGLVPEALVAELEGARVRVTGTFRFAPARGRLIDVEHLEVLAAP